MLYHSNEGGVVAGREAKCRVVQGRADTQVRRIGTSQKDRKRRLCAARASNRPYSEATQQPHQKNDREVASPPSLQRSSEPIRADPECIAHDAPSLSSPSRPAEVAAHTRHRRTNTRDEALRMKAPEHAGLIYLPQETKGKLDKRASQGDHN